MWSGLLFCGRVPVPPVRASLVAALPPVLVMMRCFRGFNFPVGDMFDREQWERWFAELERPFIFLLILLFVVIAVGLLARFSERFRQ